MKDYLLYHPYAKTGVFALLLIPMVILMNSFSPDLSKVPIGFSSSILAFEFVSNHDEVREVLGPLSSSEITDIDKLNYVDFGFMLFYSAFLLLFIRKSYSIFSNPLIRFLIWIPPIILLSDFIENLQLLHLTDLYRSEAIEKDYLKTIRLLGIFTWIKWSVLAICFACLSIFIYNKGKVAKAISLLFLMPVILLILCLYFSTRQLLDQFATSIFLMFFLLVVFCFTYSTKDKNNITSLSSSL